MWANTRSFHQYSAATKNENSFRKIVFDFLKIIINSVIKQISVESFNQKSLYISNISLFDHIHMSRQDVPLSVWMFQWKKVNEEKEEVIWGDTFPIEILNYSEIHQTFSLRYSNYPTLEFYSNNLVKVSNDLMASLRFLSYFLEIWCIF